MTAAPVTGTTGARPSVDHPSPATGALAGSGTIARWGLRRERLPLLLWTLATAGSVLSSFRAIAALYPSPADRLQLAETITTNPAFVALNGPVLSTSVGGVTAWRTGVIGAAAVAFVGAWTVVRRTRADEETGRAELLASGVLGRSTLLACALALGWTGALFIGLVCALGAVAQGQPVADSLALGAALAGPGLVFAAVAAVAAQVFESARSALGAVGVCLGVSYGLRAIGDTSPAAGWLSWFSPLGWSQKVAPFGAMRWWVLLLFAATTLLCAAAAQVVHRRRDLGRGLFAARRGPAGSARLHTPEALAVRIHRSQFVGWLVGLGVFGLLTGSLAATSDRLLAGNAKIEQLVRQLGGTGSIADEMFAAMGAIAGLLAAAYAVAAALRIRTEETAGRAELALSAAVGRGRLLAGHVAFALLGPAVLLAAAGIASGLTYGGSVGQLRSGLGSGLEAMTVQIPAVLVIGGLAIVFVGWFPRLSAAGWVVLGVATLLGQVGRTLGLSQAVLDLSPFSHVPPVPAGTLDVVPLVVLTVVGAAMVAAGFVGFARRDIG